MSSKETQARQVFTDASKQLEKALADYTAARKQLHDVTGEFVGADHSATMRFTSVDGRPGKAEIALTDC
jgi:hypothetical protein